MELSVPKVKTCCIFVSLRSATKFFGWYYLVSSLVGVLGEVYQFSFYLVHTDNLWLRMIMFTDILLKVLQATFSLLLLLGAYQKEARYILWWVLCNIVLTILGIFGLTMLFISIRVLTTTTLLYLLSNLPSFGECGTTVMRLYQERLATMCQWFDQWNESGQMVALIKMLTRIPPTQARFLTIALENSLTECAELALREQEANNPGYISNLLNENKERAMEELMLHIPLLRPGNKDAKHAYLGVIPVMLNYCLESSQLLDKCTQLLVYTHIHPALKEDSRTFDPWRKALTEKVMNINTPNVCSTEPVDPGQGKVRRSNSLTPPFAVTPSQELWTSQDDLSVVRKTGRRFSLSLCEGAPLSPQSSQASSGSGSESHLEDLRPGYEAVGMKDVKSWLKSLRLHKYSRLFSQLTYAQMLSLTEETFSMTVESVGAGSVTQGAQRKILLSITKLRDRYPNLCRLEQEITEGSGVVLLSAMDEVKAVLLTPLKPYEEGDASPVDDLPSQITRVLYKVCTLLLVCGVVDDEALSTFLSLLDSCLRLEAFTTQQKHKMSSWRLQISQHISQIRQAQQQQYGFLSVPPARYPPITRPLRNHCGGLRSHPPHTHHTHTQSFLAKRPSLQDNPHHLEYGAAEEAVHMSVQRTHSAPPHPPPDPSPSHSSTTPAPETDPELNSRLERLCLRMTEQSLEL